MYEQDGVLFGPDGNPVKPLKEKRHNGLGHQREAGE